MLRSLRVRNFALIDELSLEPGPGLTAFTGETGAGKSILIEALGFLLGARATTDWIRAGAERLSVEGEFETREGRVAARRELDASGRSKAWLDGRPATLAALSALGERLVDFHGQHEHQTLLKPAIQLDLLDAFGGLAARREEAAGAYRRRQELSERLKALAMSEEERLRRVDLCRFQLQEIEDVDPKPGEEEALAEELPRLKNAGRLGQLAAAAYASLYEREGAAEESLREAEQALEEMARLDPAMGEALAAVGRARSEASEAAAALARYRDGFEADPARLDEVLGRQDRLARLKKKYGATLSDVLAYRDRARAELEALENRDLSAKEVERELGLAEKALRKACDELHAARLKAAKKLSDRVQRELKDLGLENARLSISVEMEDGGWGPTGADRVEFLIAPNPGEALKPLRAVASGGELSRVMLALKTVLAAQDRVGLLVFDEVDTGVGAAVGRAVGRKLADLGAERQVFCVTHLPQVACYARAHFHVSKAVSEGRTRTKVERLEGEERLKAIARMLGGSQVTKTSLRHAQELMESL